MLGLRTVVYFVEDLEKAKAWYTAVLGKKPYYDTPHYIGFNVGGYELGLHPAENLAVAASSVAYWGVENARKAYSDLLIKGGIEHEKVSDVGGGILIGSVIDPCGNIFGVIENPHFSLPAQ